jgi:hypothetical protein
MRSAPQLAVALVLLAAPSLGLTAVGALGGCRPGEGGGDDDDTPGHGVFEPTVTQVQVEIDYETDREPYTGEIIGIGDTFDLVVNNLDRLFAGTKQLVVPRTVEEMEEIGAVDDEQLTSPELLALAEAHRALFDSATEKTYYVLFVSGNFTDGNGPQPGVLGVSLGDTGVIAMFKDVIESTQGVIPNVERFVEQSTLVHELGHAIGLVDNGVEPVTAHHDTEHGAHCSNEDCVMYWLNEGASDMAQFAGQFVVSGDSILFDDACLGDVDALTGGP